MVDTTEGSYKTGIVTILDLIEQGIYDPETITENEILEYICLKELRDHTIIWFPHVSDATN